jgi:hypothetical protein
MNEWIVIGLVILALAWFSQLYYSLRYNGKIIQPIFITLYIIGFMLIIYDEYNMGLTHLVIINIPNILLPVFVLAANLFKKENK